MKKTISLAVVFSFLFTVGLVVQADKLTDYENEKKKVNSELTGIKNQKTVLAKRIEEKKAKQKQLEEERKKRQQEYEELSKQIDSLEKEIAMLQLAVEEAEDRYEEQKDLFKTRLRVMYQNSNISYLESLLESRNLGEFYQKLRIISLIARNDKKLLTELDAAKKDVEFKKGLQELIKTKTESMADEKKEVIASLMSSRASLETEISRDKKMLQELERREDELIKESARISKMIQELLSNEKYNKGKMKWPCPGNTTITSQFGNRLHPILKVYKLHTGIDIAANYGANIVAAQDGKVIVAGWQNGYGNTVIIDHGGKIATLYAHCSKLLVKVGDKVKAGDVIAKVGSTGWSTGPHLHFEIIKDGSPINPLSGGYLK